jgi:hypothetical protein
LLFRKNPDDGQSPKTQYLCILNDVFRGPSRKILGQYLKICNDRFLEYPFQFIIR